MNYQKHYDQLILNARNKILADTYFEKHHVIPRSMGGTNVSSNIVRLSAKEHFVAHHLLWKIYKNQCMAYAFWNMCNTRIYNKGKITARVFESIRLHVVEVATARLSDPLAREHLSRMNMGHPVSAETREKISKAHTGRKQDPDVVQRRADSNRGVLKGKTYDEIHGVEKSLILRQNLSEKNKGKKYSEETNEKKRQSLIGRPCSEETRDKISKGNTGKIRSAESRKKISDSHQGIVRSEESNKKTSDTMRGHKKSEETREKMRKPKSEEHKAKISETKQRKKREALELTKTLDIQLVIRYN